MPESALNSSVAPHCRRATEDDASVISQLFVSSFSEYSSQYTPEGFAATTPTPAEIVRRMQEGPVWVALTGSKIVGSVAAVLQDAGVLYVRGMAVVPEARGMRIGSLLFEMVRQYALMHHCTKLVLSTTPFLHRAIRLYERLGFVRTDSGPHDLFRTPLFTMEKLL